MVFLEVGAAVKPSHAYSNEVDIVRHDLGQCMAVMLGPRVTESLQYLAQRLFIVLRMDIGDRGGGQHRQPQHAKTCLTTLLMCGPFAGGRRPAASCVREHAGSPNTASMRAPGLAGSCLYHDSERLCTESCGRHPELNLLQHRHNLLNRTSLLLHGKLLALRGPVCQTVNRQNGPIRS